MQPSFGKISTNSVKNNTQRKIALAKLRICQLMIVFVCIFCIQSVFAAANPPANLVNKLQAGQAVDFIIEYESTAIEKEAANRRQLNPDHVDDEKILDYKSTQYKLLKQQVDSELPSTDLIKVKEYSHLPMSFLHVSSLAALAGLRAHSKIKAIYENGQAHRVLAQSLPLIYQPAVAVAGDQGSGTTVAVIDDGIDYTNTTFGSCTAPGVPATCHVSTSLLFGTGSTDTTHGTNVSAIVLGVAPASNIAMLNAFSGTSANFSDIISAINWTIANRKIYNIVAINMSLGDGTQNTSPCSTNNAFLTPITNAINAKISVVAAAGNDNYISALGSPACTPGVISVGAVYDSNLSNQGYPYGVIWGNAPNTCTDSVTGADKVTCFSDSASFLTMLAPGALITAAGIIEGGTSQATPHVAGAVAVLRAVFPSETLTQTQTRLTGSGVMITDSRNGIIKPRLNLLAAARPANDLFANRSSITGTSGSASGTSLLATKETGEPNHVGNSGGSSIWWKWTAPSAGQVSLDTKVSGFDTALAVYTGSSVSALVPIASNYTAGGMSNLLFEAKAGTEYEIAVDGANGAAGSAILNWSLNTTAAANLSVNLSGPTAATDGTPAGFTLKISNAGPQAATNVVTTITLPAGASFVSGPAACSATATIVTCLSGTIANGASVSLLINIFWNNIIATETLTASVTSDLPNPVPSGSTSNVQIVISNNNNAADVPTLPFWAELILAMILGGIAIGVKRKKAS
jgi:uncharacterized repeat protein (TIGR01451 family)